MRGLLCFMTMAVLLGGCSSSAGIESLGGGQYLVSGEGAFGEYEIADERAKARAQEFCQKDGRTMEVVNISHDEDPAGGFARLTFECH